MDATAWIALVTLAFTVIGTVVGGYLYLMKQINDLKIQIARQAAEIEGLQRIRADWREFILKLQEVE